MIVPVLPWSRSLSRQAAGVVALAVSVALLAAACGGNQPSSSSTSGSPAPTPLGQAPLDPASIDMLHLADEPQPPADHLDPGAHGLPQDYTDPHGVFSEKAPVGTVTLSTDAFDTGRYKPPDRVYLSPKTAAPVDQPQIDAVYIPDLQTNVDPADIQARVVSFEADRLAAQPFAKGATVSFVGHRVDKFRGIPAECFKLRVNGVQLKVLTLVLGHSVFIISMIGSEDPPASFDAFAVNFELITNPSPRPTPTVPPPPTPSSGSPSPSGGSPSSGQAPTPTGQSPTPGSGSPSPAPSGTGGGGGTPLPI
ncbi:MAG: hypothetical protein ACR2GX_04540 [Candidatus Dormibacteria bacterium]